MTVWRRYAQHVVSLSSLARHLPVCHPALAATTPSVLKMKLVSGLTCRVVSSPGTQSPIALILALSRPVSLSQYIALHAMHTQPIANCA